MVCEFCRENMHYACTMSTHCHCQCDGDSGWPYEAIRNFAASIQAEARQQRMEACCYNCNKPESEHALHGNWCPANNEDQLFSNIRKFLPRMDAFWVIERFEDGKSQGYWTGDSSRDFTNNIEKAIQFRRKDDALRIRRKWHWRDVEVTEHSYIPNGENK